MTPNLPFIASPQARALHRETLAQEAIEAVQEAKRLHRPTRELIRREKLLVAQAAGRGLKGWAAE